MCAQSAEFVGTLEGGGGLGGSLGGGGLGQFPQHIPARYMSPDVVSNEELPQLGFEPVTCVCVLQIRSPQFLLKVSHSFSESPTAIQLSCCGMSIPEGGTRSVQN